MKQYYLSYRPRVPNLWGTKYEIGKKTTLSSRQACFVIAHPSGDLMIRIFKTVGYILLDYIVGENFFLMFSCYVATLWKEHMPSRPPLPPLNALVLVVLATFLRAVTTRVQWTNHISPTCLPTRLYFLGRLCSCLLGNISKKYWASLLLLRSSGLDLPQTPFNYFQDSSANRVPLYCPSIWWWKQRATS